MTTRFKRVLSYLVVFGFGLGLGTFGGYILNDITSREDPNAIQQIRQDLEQQQRLDDFFADQTANQANRRGSEGSAVGTGGVPPTD